MSDKSKILMFSLFGLAATVLLIQYEIREYLRFVPSNYFALKFVLQYGMATGFIAISLIGGLILFVKHKTLLSSRPLIIILLGLSCVWFIRRQTTIIEDENTVIKNDLYTDIKTGELLDGTYKSPSRWDGFGNDVHFSKHQYEKGIPAGKWMYSYKGDLIHSGVYLEEEDLKNKLISLTKSKRIDFDLWQEGDYPFMTIDLIKPIFKDSNTIETISKLAIQSLRTKYKFKTLYIYNVSENDRIELKEIEIK